MAAGAAFAHTLERPTLGSVRFFAQTVTQMSHIFTSRAWSALWVLRAAGSRQQTGLLLTNSHRTRQASQTISGGEDGLVTTPPSLPRSRSRSMQLVEGAEPLSYGGIRYDEHEG